MLKMLCNCISGRFEYTWPNLLTPQTPAGRENLYRTTPYNCHIYRRGGTKPDYTCSRLRREKKAMYVKTTWKITDFSLCLGLFVCYEVYIFIVIIQMLLHLLPSMPTVISFLFWSSIAHWNCLACRVELWILSRASWRRMYLGVSSSIDKEIAIEKLKRYISDTVPSFSRATVRILGVTVIIWQQSDEKMSHLRTKNRPVHTW